ncbi:MAG: YraN family protein [Flavobacteriaceae bacterium]|nr:MAG: YraN family protein [Flavobacteriaceae bacterium]
MEKKLQALSFGRKAEQAAQKFLIDKGYLFLAANWRYYKSEIDLIFEHQKTLVIVEVKARSESFLISPLDAVDAKKMKMLVLGANGYLETHKLDLPIRFDVVTVVGENPENQTIEHTQEAFHPFF